AGGRAGRRFRASGTARRTGGTRSRRRGTRGSPAPARRLAPFGPRRVACPARFLSARCRKAGGRRALPNSLFRGSTQLSSRQRSVTTVNSLLFPGSERGPLLRKLMVAATVYLVVFAFIGARARSHGGNLSDDYP